MKRRTNDRDRSKMQLSIVIIYSIIVISSSSVHGRRCDLGASDLIFVVQASFDLPNDDFESIKSFIDDFVGDLDVGNGRNVCVFVYIVHLYILVANSRRSHAIRRCSYGE